MCPRTVKKLRLVSTASYNASRIPSFSELEKENSLKFVTNFYQREKNFFNLLFHVKYKCTLPQSYTRAFSRDKHIPHLLKNKIIKNKTKQKNSCQLNIEEFENTSLLSRNYLWNLQNL